MLCPAKLPFYPRISSAFFPINASTLFFFFFTPISLFLFFFFFCSHPFWGLQQARHRCISLIPRPLPLFNICMHTRAPSSRYRLTISFRQPTRVCQRGQTTGQSCMDIFVKYFPFRFFLPSFSLVSLPVFDRPPAEISMLFSFPFFSNDFGVIFATTISIFATRAAKFSRVIRSKECSKVDDKDKGS